MSAPVTGSPCTVHAVRLEPGQEIKSALLEFVRSRGLRAAFVMTCVGSVTSATLRLANATASNRNEIVTIDKRCEIVSLVGTFDAEGGCHLHASLSDEAGVTVGGHVMEMTVFTTAELVLGEATGLVFGRTMDDRTGFPELSVHARGGVAERE